MLISLKARRPAPGPPPAAQAARTSAAEHQLRRHHRVRLDTEVIALAGRAGLRDGEAAGLHFKSLQRPFSSGYQVSVWVSVRRRTAAPRRLQPSLNPHVSASRNAPERAKAELESERPARDRGFESGSSLYQVGYLA